jgi:hypothetical protein
MISLMQFSGIQNAQHRARVDAFRTELANQANEHLARLKGSWWAKRPRGDIQRLFTNGILAFGPPKAKFNILFNNNALPQNLDIEAGEKNPEANNEMVSICHGKLGTYKLML